ncbi:unnamed protein product [Vitrella brassicaformis CCMP3155]|uniref:Apple domain-containing protein n=1 Tax=Vitrella brassicaformis (strain CCMP3155) TaxID=1169540 RepID=A0A0G4EYY1_VITBC|nr:unnamed protein product [Vitrella brassicaformis CCMP3155]|eukprot:CEM04166.1 unnamed protein product [Vitrella brassicaformis CCMP3155]
MMRRGVALLLVAAAGLTLATDDFMNKQKQPQQQQQAGEGQQVDQRRLQEINASRAVEERKNRTAMYKFMQNTMPLEDRKKTLGLIMTDSALRTPQEKVTDLLDPINLAPTDVKFLEDFYALIDGTYKDDELIFGLLPKGFFKGLPGFVLGLPAALVDAIPVLEAIENPPYPGFITISTEEQCLTEKEGTTELVGYDLKLNECFLKCQLRSGCTGITYEQTDEDGVAIEQCYVHTSKVTGSDPVTCFERIFFDGDTETGFNETFVETGQGKCRLSDGTDSSAPKPPKFIEESVEVEDIIACAELCVEAGENCQGIEFLGEVELDEDENASSGAGRCILQSHGPPSRFAVPQCYVNLPTGLFGLGKLGLDYV